VETPKKCSAAERLAGQRISCNRAFRRDGDAVSLLIGPPALGQRDGGSVTLLNINPQGDSGVEFIELEDATWSAAQLRARIIAAARTDGNDMILGFDGDDLVSGGAGDDVAVYPGYKAGEEFRSHRPLAGRLGLRG
jgi:hypothetical protein